MDLAPNRARGRRRGRSLALLLAAAALFGCGPDATPPAGGLVLRPRVGPAGPAAEPGAPETLELGLPEDPAEWQIDALSAERVVERARRGEPERELLELRGRGQKRLRVPGPFALEGVNRVVVELKVFDPTNVTVQLVAGERALVGSSTVGVGLARDVQAVVLDLPHARLNAERPDGLWVVIGQGGPVRLGGVSLIAQPIEGWLPRADGEPALVDIEGESRRARGLASGAPWSGRVEVPPGGELGFSYGVPRHLHLYGTAPAELVVRAVAGGERAEARLPLDDPPTQPRWREGRLDLAALAGRQAELSFELVPPAGAPADLTALCALGELRVAARGSAPRTVLLVTSDTHRADYMGLAGRGVEVQTPTLDALAARGVYFEDCFSSTNITNPSHIALMTAVHPRDLGILDNASAVSEQAATLAERFRDAGFVTLAAVSTRHLGDDVSGLGQGFDRMSWPTAGDRDGSETIALLERWLPEAEGLPLFVWLHSFDAHTPYEPPPEFGARYYGPERDPFDPALPAPLEERLLPAFLSGLKDLAYPEAMYRGEISFLDASLARLFEAPRVRDGVVAFTADHGESLGQHGVYYDHGDLYPDTIHVPLILAWPGGPAGVRVTEPVRQTDVGRTLLDLVGLERAEFPGTDLRRYVDGDAPSDPRFMLAANYASAAMTWRGKHLILHLRAHAERNRLVPAELHGVELYDLRADPACTVDLLEREFELARTMRASLLDWLGAAQDLGWARESSRDPELMAALARLGYTDDGGGASLEQFFQPDCTCEWCERFR